MARKCKNNICIAPLTQNRKTTFSRANFLDFLNQQQHKVYNGGGGRRKTYILKCSRGKEDGWNIGECSVLKTNSNKSVPARFNPPSPSPNKKSGQHVHSPLLYNKCPKQLSRRKAESRGHSAQKWIQQQNYLTNI